VQRAIRRLLGTDRHLVMCVSMEEGYNALLAFEKLKPRSWKTDEKVKEEVLKFREDWN